MAPSFSQDEVFPIIRRIIQTIHEQTQDFATHHEIVHALLEDQAGQQEVYAAQQVRPGVTPEQIAANMVPWFSQKITAGYSRNDHELFERKKIHRCWAYRPR